MEKGITLRGSISGLFACEEADIKAYSPLTLAYIGDSIYDLIIRTVVVERGNRPANSLHKASTGYVNAAAQAAMAEALTEIMTDEEMAVYKRGRNAKSNTSAKNASINDYRKATGLEALFGYLYLKDDTQRLLDLVKSGLERTGKEL